MNHYSFQISMNDRLLHEGIVACRNNAVAEKALRDHYGIGKLGTVLMTKIVPHLQPTFVIDEAA